MTSNNTWPPILVTGQELDRFLARTKLTDTAKDNLKQSALSILTKASNPNLTKDIATGLVVGYVQSGKTMSFESVIALGKDNGFKQFIVIAGIANPLLKQSSTRIRKDFGVDDSNEPRRWTILNNLSNKDEPKNSYKQAIDGLKGNVVAGVEQQYILITVLKHHTHLKNLADLIQDLNPTLPTLIIDDEADQASLNTKAQVNIKKVNQEESKTYAAIRRIRDSLPNHTYLQYTATPQAPLLINKIDILSADFVEILKSGEGYTGGQVFFDPSSSLTKIIPEDEKTSNFEEDSDTPPESFLEALRIYIIGVAAGYLKNQGIGNRSMLVHPSHATVNHQSFYNWTVDTFNNWKRIWSKSETDEEKIKLVDEMYSAYKDLQSTVDDLKSYEEIKNILPATFTKIVIKEINSSTGKTPEIDWGMQYGHILVGGQAMDRGFTVEGLTVTYMPRGIGVGNIDTLQQRARFFGYRSGYIGFCRVYLDQTALETFQGYLKHEEGVRDSLNRNNQQGKSLKEWKRTFWLDPSLKACRNNILNLESIERESDGWFYPRVIIADNNVISSNQSLIKNFLHNHQDIINIVAGHPDRTPIQQHKVIEGIDLKYVLDQLLIDYKMANPLYSAYFAGITLQIEHAITLAEKSGTAETCDIYIMSALSSINRTRSVSEFNKQSTTFQGAAPSRDNNKYKKGEIYPGDTAFKNDNKITIQIYSIDIVKAKNDPTVVLKDVKVLAIWIPTRLKGCWSSQIDN